MRNLICHYGKIIGVCCYTILVMISTIGHAQNPTTSFGNTFIHSEGNLTTFDHHEFDNSLQGLQPGIIGAERLPTRGYFNFGQNASWANAANGKFVDGYVRFFGNDKFLFPIGDNDKFRPVAISGGSYAEACYYGIDPTLAITSDLKGGNYPILPLTGPFDAQQHQNDITIVSEYEYWDINGTDATIITLTWDDESNIGAITSNELATLTIAGWDGEKWVALPSTVDPNSISLNDNSCQFNGPPSTLTAGSISSDQAIVPSQYEVYTFASICSNMTVDITQDTVICLGDIINLVATSNPGAIYTWDNNETGSTISVNPTENTTYAVTATLGSCMATNFVDVDVSETAVDLGLDQFTCDGELFTITAFAPGSNNTFEWSNGYTGGSELAFIPDSSMTLSVTVTNEFGCTSTDAIELEVRDRPNVFTGRDRSLCLGDSVFIQAFGANPGGTYLWNTGSTSDIINVSPTEDTDYEVYLTENGCIDTAYVSVFVLPNAYVEIDVDTLICEGEIMDINTSGTPGSFLWSTGDTTSSISVLALENVEYAVTVTSDEGCYYFDSVEFEYYDESHIDLVEEIFTCPGEPVTITAGGIYESGLWSTGASGSSITVSPTFSTTYDFTGFYRNCSATKYVTVSIVNDLELEMGPPVTICAGEEITFDLDSLSGNFEWSTSETTPSITVSPTQNTTYSVTITSGACTATDDITVLVESTGCQLDLEVLKTVNDMQPAYGDTITFTVELNNLSGLDATNIDVLEEIQSGFNFISYTATHGSYDNILGVWTVPSLIGNETAQLTIDVEVLPSGDYSNTAQIDGIDQEDPEPINDIAVINIIPYDPNDTGAAIGDYVWWDKNGDGIQDFVEDGIENIEVELYYVSSPLTPMAETLSDSEGYFCFTDLDAGDYFVKFIIPDSMMATLPMVSLQGLTDADSDSDITDFFGYGTTDMISVADNQEIKSCDGGLHKWSSIGDIAWFDSDEGIENRYDENLDNLYEGVVIDLYNADTGDWMGQEITDANGHYKFDQLKPGNYYLQIAQTPSGKILVPPFMAAGHLDSDFIYPNNNTRNTGTTNTIVLGVEEDNEDIDAGLVNGTVPIELLDFWGERIVHEEFNKLFWITETEVNSDYFIVERSLNDVLNFEEIGIVDAAGNSIQKEYYTFDDLDSRKAGIYYYRLILVDLDGSTYMSKIISIEVEEDAEETIVYKVYPIPTTDYLNIEVTLSDEKYFEGFLVNNLGQNVRKLERRTIESGRSLITLDLIDLAQGQYYLNFYLNEKQYISKILVMD